MKRGFTLIEILVVMLIVAILIGTAVMNFGAGLKATRIRDATRTVQMLARHAKAVALLKQRPVVLLFEEVYEDGVFVKSRVSLSFGEDAKGEVANSTAAVGQSGGSDGIVRTLAGEMVETEEVQVASEDASGDEPDPLMAEPSEFEGVRIHAAVQEEENVRRSRVSVYSNVGALLQQNNQAAAKSQTSSDAAKDEADPSAAEVARESTFSVVFEANGRCDPFSIAIYKDGEEEENGLKILVSRFGKVTTEADDE